MLAARGLDPADDELLEAYASLEAELERGPYRPYRDVLAGCLRGVCARYAAEPTADELAAFSGSVAQWPAFPDSSDALTRLSHRFRLGVITNCDDDLFSASSRRLGITFDPVVTAEQARSYKPSHRNFELALDRIDVPADRVLHVAQSLYHDHVPAKRLGMATAWIDRRRGRVGFGATPAAEATPDLAVPDLRAFADLALR